MRKEVANKKTSGYYREECNKIASFYDLGIKLLCLPFGGEGKFRKGFVDFISPRKGEWLLDVCCGTGTLSIMIAEKVGLQGVVVGIDLSPNMIRVAKQKGKHFNLEFVLASAELLPFKENKFNKALCSFGLHEMTKTGRRNALIEIRRVLKKNGRLNVCDGNSPKNLFVRFIFKVILTVVEEETAYNMIFKENLWGEMIESGFKITECKKYFLDTLQMISAKNNYATVTGYEQVEEHRHTTHYRCRLGFGRNIGTFRLYSRYLSPNSSSRAASSCLASL